MNMKKILEMKAKREDARLKAMAVLNKAEAEDRFLSEDEQKDIDKYEEEIRAWDESIGRAEKLLAIEPEDRSTEKPEVKPTPSKDNEKRFASFGEQLMAAYRAATPGGKVDERLTTRAASGLNESTPSDGGFLVQQDFVTELLKRTYETGILASKVKKIPISTNANGMKINAIDEDGVEEIRQLILDLRSEDRVIIIACHDRSEMELLADEVICMKNGELISEKGCDDADLENV